MRKLAINSGRNLLALMMFLTLQGMGQFAPPPGDESSTAIHADSSVINGWAAQVTVARGFLNAADTSLGKVTHGSPADATGEADNQVVSLGDGGVATYMLDTPLSDGEAFDFAVYENSFSDDFLELAFVEVSSDGEHFIRFPSVSLTQTETQIGAFDMLQATQLHNFAGKYRAFFGTPFDLAELSDSANIDINKITHIRIRDVIGSLNNDIATYDSEGNRVNDPWPTDFASGGFDLDAVALINLQGSANSISELTDQVKLYPNPVVNQLKLIYPEQVEEIRVMATDGRVLCSETDPGLKHQIDMSSFHSGLYLIRILKNGKSITKRVIKR